MGQEIVDGINKSVSDRNFAALRENDTRLNKKIEVLMGIVSTMQTEIAILKDELVNTKQLMGHLMGRGTGSTTPEDM
jgi:hypothetical protein